MSIWACARQSSPNGGPRDNTPPEIVYARPAGFSTHFEGSGFEIGFDEYIETKDVGSQLIVSPPLKKLPKVEARGKKLLVSWEDTLAPNTTYQFNFGKSVVDVNEGNPVGNFVYVFSTGDRIDSLFVQGKVLKAADNQPAKGSFVMLYTGDADSLPMTSRPGYFAQTDSSGRFQIRYLPGGDFKIFVLREQSVNYIYDGPPEEIGFSDTRVESSLNDSTPGTLLAQFMESDTNQYIREQKGTDYGYYETVFNRPASNPEIEFIDIETNESLKAYNLINGGRDSLQSWVIFPERDNFEEVEVRVKLGETLADTSFWYIETNPKYRDKSKLTLSSNTNRNRLDLNKSFSLTSNNPLAEADTSLVYFLEDSMRVYPTDFERLDVARKINVYYPFKGSSNYIFKAKAGAFRDVFGNYSDSISIPFSLQESEFYGSLTAKVALGDSVGYPAILRLLDEKNREVRRKEFEDKTIAVFKQLNPGKYRLQVIYDENENGEWDTGNYRLHRQPEKLSYYTEPLEVRSNWELDIEWQVTNPFLE